MKNTLSFVALLCSLQIACTGLSEKKQSGYTFTPTVKPEPMQPSVAKRQQAVQPLPGIQPEKPLETAVPASPAVVALLHDAEASIDRGNIDVAVTTLERALRIDPRNPQLFYRLAELRLQQEKPRLAEDLARKSILLSAGDRVLKQHCWLLIAQARQIQGNEAGAQSARDKAAALANTRGSR